MKKRSSYLVLVGLIAVLIAGAMAYGVTAGPLPETGAYDACVFRPYAVGDSDTVGTPWLPPMPPPPSWLRPGE